MTMRLWSILAPVIGVIIFLLDRLTKVYFFQHPELSITVIPDWLWLQLFVNNDMALSLPLYPLLYYTLTTAVILILIARLVHATAQALTAEYIFIIIILSGAISNLLDRFVYGGVIDFIQLRFGSIFNIADAAIVVAIGLWIGMMLRYDRAKKISTHD